MIANTYTSESYEILVLDLWVLDSLKELHWRCGYKINRTHQILAYKSYFVTDHFAKLIEIKAKPLKNIEINLY